MIKVGVVFPQTEYSADPSTIRDYAQMAEGLGFSHILAYDHVLGANPDRPGGWAGPYSYQHSFQEPLVMFSYMAAVTKNIEFTTGVIILPQRQTALFAKQAATLDVMSAGRTRLGVGLGWNEVEYQALNEDFHTRGRRIEEQIRLLRLLWTQPLVQFEGRWHHIPDAGLNPLPVQRPIPIWLGGHAEAVLRRAASLADGWMPGFRNPDDARHALDALAGYLEKTGRSIHNFGIEARLPYGDGNPDVWERLVRGWQAAGATHLSLNTMGAGFDTPAQHFAALATFSSSIGLSQS
jgi:probable F420-dependent oxidoreductase